MKKNGIHVYNKKDSVLNTPGQFFFQIREDGEYKSNNVHISRKIFDEIKNKIIAAFKTISQNLKLMLNRFNAGSENDKIKYYTDITNKLDKFVDMSNHRGFGFPGLQVISLTSKQSDLFAQLKERVLICEKSDGVRYLLVHFANGKCVMLGRSLEFFLVEFTTKLPVVVVRNQSANCNPGFLGNSGNTSSDWEIVSILDGELILDEIEQVKKIKEEFKVKCEENANKEKRIAPQRQVSNSDLIFGNTSDENIDEFNNINDNDFIDNNENKNINNYNDQCDEDLFDIEHERKLAEAKENEYLRGLTVQQKSTMVYVNDDLFQVKFVVFDAIILENVNIGSLPFHKRLDHLAFYFKGLSWPKIHENIRNSFLKTYLSKIEPGLNGFREHLLDSANNPLKSKFNQSASANSNSDLNLKFKIDLYLKDYFTFDKIKFLYEKICGKLLHENDGIILNLDDYPYYSGQATEIYKWKPQSLNTVDFQVEPKRFHRRSAYNKGVDEKENFEEIFLLKVSEARDKEKVINILLFSNKAEEDRFIQELRMLRSTSSKAVIECHFEKNEKIVQENFHKYEVLKRNEFEYIQDMHDNTTQYGQSYKVGYWKFMRFRKDKLYGNSLQTFYKVWESIEDDLTIDKMQERMDFYKKNPEIVKATYEKTKNIPFSIILSKAQHQFSQNNGLNPFNTKPSGQNTNIPFINAENSSHDLSLLSRKRAANGAIDGSLNNTQPHNIFGVQNTANYINYEREKEEKQIKIKAKKEERRNKALNAIETKKTNTKESLDMALGIANAKSSKGNGPNLILSENADNFNKKNSIEDNDLSDLSSEE